MPRAFSSNTKVIYWWLWYLPWASAADIARGTGQKANSVSNVLASGREGERVAAVGSTWPRVRRHRQVRVFQHRRRGVARKVGVGDLLVA